MYLFCGKVKSLYALSPEEINSVMIRGLYQNKIVLEEFNKREKKICGISIHKLVQQIKEANLDEISIILEYFVPGNMLRHDAVLVGYAHGIKLEIMVVELKECESIKGSPAAQLHHYLRSLKCYHSEFQRNSPIIKLSSMSCIQNFEYRNRLFKFLHEIYKANYMES
ncbi:hypothetical protein DT250_04340 [Bacillus sp. AR2-1]|uniref:hypothetical protein n=1 Tax=Bacillus sp. AR2-1 TaxID=2217816 RepID=UPI0011ED5EF4|nr:hypothetical protein [Bacillus sp. AR2-1]KAA0776207.1 hypothetical protein DT250_04340 [Bacillus sp. AR2-1]